tara:strand:- start:49 stop:339 length:291 start_codon:yes stop_codon:yes gene_type:complete
MIEKTLPDGTVVYINPKYEKILDGREKQPEEELIGTPPDITEEDIKYQEVLVKAAQAKRYLNETDWYAHRKAETGKAIPDDVLEKRAQARIDASVE